ncbi:MAG: hydroxymethylbilane synthase [Actinomycetaceae bacterium]|nr:hydroxymethylbilane synthase [Actinomycetaceae bacterium]
MAEKWAKNAVRNAPKKASEPPAENATRNVTQNGAAAYSASHREFVLGTRGSELARTQSQMVADALNELGVRVRLQTIRTEGDVTAGSLSRLGGVGVFAAALRLALLDGQCDLAVHSFKDLPTKVVPGLEIGAVPTRAPAFDALCARYGLTLEELPSGATVGTGSPRRVAQLRALRPDLNFVDIRGNVGTRLARAQGPDADLDAVVLAAAGLARLGRTDAITQVLTQVLPAPAQGALAVEIRNDAPTQLRAALARINHPASRAAALAERQILAQLRAGCAAPVGAYARTDWHAVCGADFEDATALSRDGRSHLSCEPTDDPENEPTTLRLRTRVISVDGTREVTASGAVPVGSDEDATAAGDAVGTALLAQGAAQITDLAATKNAHERTALWAPGIAGPTAPGADVSACK